MQNANYLFAAFLAEDKVFSSSSSDDLPIILHNNFEKRLLAFVDVVVVLAAVVVAAVVVDVDVDVKSRNAPIVPQLVCQK